jgi:hypothetical protein
MEDEKIEINELDLNRIRPSPESVKTNRGGSKVCMIGKPGSGKSVLIKNLLFAKQGLIPTGIVVSGSEDLNSFYSDMFPDVFVFERYEKEIIDRILQRQKIAKENLSNPWLVAILDDCTDDIRIFNDPTMIGLFKNGRHADLLFILSLQYVGDLKPVIRTNIDGVFILREPNLSNREKIYRNFASIIPSFKKFNAIMDQLVNDHHCIYIDNTATTNDWRECVFWYKGDPNLQNFRFGCEDYWRFAEERGIS